MKPSLYVLSLFICVISVVAIGLALFYAIVKGKHEVLIIAALGVFALGYIRGLIKS